MLRRLTMVAAAALFAAIASPVTAGADGGTYSLTVNPKASYANAYQTAITLTGTYTCSATWTPLGDFSGVNANVSQIQKKGSVVMGQGGNGGPDYAICDGLPHAWTIQVNAGDFQTAATWKGGKATAMVNGNTADGFDCGGMGGGGTSNCMGAQVTRVIQISR